MKRKGLLVLILVTLVILIGCVEDIPAPELSDADWIKISTMWTDSDYNEFSYVPSDEGGHIDIESVGYRCYIEEFSYANNQLSGSYTYFDSESELQGPYDVTITFSYASGVLTVSYSEQGTEKGVLDGVTMHLTPPEDS
jgi:hypothetical protein